MTYSNSLAIDIETYSPVDLGKSGVYAYASHPDFEILLIAYRFGDEDATHIIDIACLSREDAVMMVEIEHARFFEALHDPTILHTAFNANFERTCLAQYFGYMNPEEWECTMIRAAILGLPMSLATVGEVIGLPPEQQKLKTGKALIQYFCKPCRATKVNGGRTRNLPRHAPEKWELFKTYCIQDVDTEQAILSRLNHFGGMSESEHRLWCFDQRMNDGGIELDLPFIQNVLDHDALAKDRLMDEAKRIMGVSNPNSRAQTLEWLKSVGHPMESFTKETVAEKLKEDLPAEVRRVLAIKQALGKTSTAKFAAMQNAVCPDGRLRGVLQFYGATRTGRWAGRIVQVHNLPQNKIEDLDECRRAVADNDFDTVEMVWGETAFIFSQLIRTAFVAGKGKTFVVSDFSAIEARVLAWLAKETWREKVFAEGGDIYCTSASAMFHVPVEKHGVNGHLRQKGKVAELACGYGGGVGAMLKMSGGSIPEEELPGIVAAWREASPNVVKLWKRMEGAAKSAIVECRTRGNAARCGRNNCIAFYMQDNVLFMELPSGRRIAYWDARVVRWDDGYDHIMYGGVNQTSKKWTDLETYSGKLVENAVQAIARDCLAEAMMRVTQAGYRIVMHVHDEMIIEHPAEDTDALDKVNALMGITPTWAEGLILRGDGYTTDYYKKD